MQRDSSSVDSAAPMAIKNERRGNLAEAMIKPNAVRLRTCDKINCFGKDRENATAMKWQSKKKIAPQLTVIRFWTSAACELGSRHP